MTDEHFLGKITQKAIIYDGERVLITRDELDALWELPGGRMHLHENPYEGLAREIREELGAEVEIGDVVHVEQFYQTRTKDVHVLLAYRATLAEPEKPLAPDESEVAEHAWITEADMGDYSFYDNIERALRTFFDKRHGV